MKKFKTSSLVCLMLGIVLLLIGIIQPFQYEKASGESYRVNAIVTSVREKGSLDLAAGQTQTEYVVYGDYSVMGQTYSGKKIGTYSTPYEVGDIIPTMVTPEIIGKPTLEGGIVAAIGLVVTIVGVLWMLRDKKQV